MRTVAKMGNHNEVVPMTQSRYAESRLERCVVQTFQYAEFCSVGKINQRIKITMIAIVMRK